MDRVQDLLGGPKPMEELGLKTVRGYGLYGRLASLVVSPHELLRFGNQRIAPSLYPCLELRFEVLSDQRLLVQYDIPRNLRSCLAFMYGTIGAQRAIPLHLGLPPAMVDADISPRRGVFLVTPPPSATIPACARRAGNELLHQLVDDLMRSRVADLKVAIQPVRPTRRTTRMFDLHWETCHRLVSHGDLHRFADDALRVMTVQLGLRNPHLWLVQGANTVLLQASGAHSGQPRIQRPLVFRETEVGRIEVDEPDGPTAGEVRARLEELLPWLAIGLENARNHTEAAAHRARIERELATRKETEELLIAALELLPGAAFLMSGAGEILAMNGPGQTELSNSEQLPTQLRAALESGEAHGYRVLRLERRGLSPRRALAMKREVAKDVESKVGRAQEEWKLTRRQSEVLKHLVLGRSNKEIACALGCATGTIELHVTQLLRKAASDSRMTLTAKFWTQLS
ncbi:MAG: response regulator transcription factor [Myxococcota bacterium]